MRTTTSSQKASAQLTAPARAGLLRVWAVACTISLTACERSSTEAPHPPPLHAAVDAGRPETATRVQGPTETAATPALPNHELRTYELRMEQADLRALERNAFSNQTVPATFSFGTNVFEGVQVRYRGAWARSWPKKPLKIFFAKTNRFEGQRCINLNSAWHDPALIRECLAYHVYRASGVPCSTARVVRVQLNGEFHGLYVQVQQPDQSFLADWQLKGAASYKAGSRANQSDERDLGPETAYRRHYEKQTKKRDGYEDLQLFCHALAQSRDPVEFFTRHVEVERYINYLAATALVQNWDGFNKNHYLVHDLAGSGKWIVVPWDLDRTFGDHWNWSFNQARLSPFLGTQAQPGVTGWNRLQDHFLSHPEFRARYLARLQELLQTEFTEEKLFPLIDALQAQLGRDAVLDRQRWPARNSNVRRAIAQLKQYVRDRRAYLLAEVGR